MMDSLRHIPVDELLYIANDPDKRNTFHDAGVIKYMSSLAPNVSDILHDNLPYEEIKEYVEERGKEILSKLDEKERKNMRWEHVGSTSIPGMPGTNTPDACLIYEQFPPSEKIIKALQESSFYFFSTAQHISDTDLCFMRFIPEEGFLNGSIMLLHLVDQSSTGYRLLLDVRDTCRKNQAAFDEYKENKLNAVKSSDSVRDYKLKKGSSSFINKIREKNELGEHEKPVSRYEDCK